MASDDEDEEESIERMRKEGYHFYDNLQNEVNISASCCLGDLLLV